MYYALIGPERNYIQRYFVSNMKSDMSECVPFINTVNTIQL